MRVGLVGPADGDLALLREAVEFLVTEAGVEQAVYLGIDPLIEEVVRAWAAEIAGAPPDEEQFLARAAVLAAGGSAAEIKNLLEADERVRHLACVRRVPAPPARAIEMLGERIMTIVYDKAVLDEEDIANSTLLVYGKSRQELLKRFGPRYFLTPGPLSGRKVAIVEADDEGVITVGVFDPAGTPLWQEEVGGRMTGKIMVSS